MSEQQAFAQHLRRIAGTLSRYPSDKPKGDLLAKAADAIEEQRSEPGIAAELEVWSMMGPSPEMCRTLSKAKSYLAA